MRPLYFDQAADALPKAPGVEEAAAAARACREDRSAVPVAEGLKAALYKRFGAAGDRRLLLTTGCTPAFRAILEGSLRPGDRVVVSAMEHGGALAPLERLESQGVQVEYLPCGRQGELLLDRAAELLTPDTRLAVLTHASHVCGTVMPMEAVGRLCRERGILFCVDAAQTAGVVPIDLEEMGADALCFSGHKGLLGPQGVGGALLSPRMAAALDPAVLAGLEGPDPAAAAGLLAALKWLEGPDGAAWQARRRQLTAHLIARLREYEEDGLKVFGPLDARKQVGIAAVDLGTMDSAAAARRLEENFGLRAQGGQHQSPRALEALEALPRGVLRFSVGPFTRFEDVDRLHGLVGELLGV